MLSDHNTCLMEKPILSCALADNIHVLRGVPCATHPFSTFTDGV
jgi:hypothetical protein